MQFGNIGLKEILDEHGVESEIVEFTSLGDRSLGGNLSSSVGHLFTQSITSWSKDQLISLYIRVKMCLWKSRNLSRIWRTWKEAQLQIWSTKFRKDIPLLEETLDSELSMDISDILDKFERGSTFGTVSGRRQSFLLSTRPDIIPLQSEDMSKQE